MNKWLLTFVTLLVAGSLFSVAEAKRYKHRHSATYTTSAHPDCNILWPCDGVVRNPRGERIVKAVGFGVSIPKYTRKRSEALPPRRVRSASSHTMPTASVAYAVGRALGGLVAPLATKVAEIQAACGSKLVSGVRHTYVAGTRRVSLHASGKAADVQGNPSCVYSLLAGWAGGYSTDYGRVKHVHISYDVEGGREMGARFVHGGGHRYAHRRNYRHRYAGA